VGFHIYKDVSSCEQAAERLIRVPSGRLPPVGQITAAIRRPS
jgi:hypothetical protein